MVDGATTKHIEHFPISEGSHWIWRGKPILTFVAKKERKKGEREKGMGLTRGQNVDSELFPTFSIFRWWGSRF